MEPFEQELKTLMRQDFFVKAELPVKVNLFKAYALGWEGAGGRPGVRKGLRGPAGASAGPLRGGGPPLRLPSVGELSAAGGLRG